MTEQIDHPNKMFVKLRRSERKRLKRQVARKLRRAAKNNVEDTIIKKAYRGYTS